VRAAAASRFNLTSATSTATAGTSVSFSVTALDPYGNTDTAYAGTVHFSSSDTSSGVVLPADSTLSSGTRTFAATLTKAGAQTVTGTSSSVTGSLALTIRAAAATTLGLSAPTTVTSRAPFNLTVTLTDPYGNVATGYTGTVTFTSSDALATVPANYIFTAADAGVRTFSVTLVTPTVLPLLQTQTITVADTANSTLRATSAPITVNPL
jgi:hypothetical protein